MERIFLLENDLKKIEILQFLIGYRGELSLHALKEQTGFSYSKLQNLAAELDADLAEGFGLSLYNKRGKIVCEQPRNFSEEYRRYLYRNSIPYNFLLAILTKTDYQLDDFARDHFISHASISRRIQPLKLYLTAHNLRLNSSKMRITGNEYFVRVLLFNLFWLADKGAELRKLSNLKATVSELKQQHWMKNISAEEIELLLAIFTYRQIDNNYLAKQTPINYICPPLSLRLTQQLQLNVPNHLIANEAQIFNYLLIYWPIYFDASDPRITFLIETFEGSQTDRLTSTFFNLCAPYFSIDNLPPAERKLLYINLLNVLSSFQVSYASPPMILDFIIDDFKEQELYYNRVEHIIRKQLTQLGREANLKWVAATLEKMTSLCTFLLLPYFDASHMDKLIVSVKNDANYYLVNDIINYCRNLDFVHLQVSLPNQHEPQADVVILPQSLHSFEIQLDQLNRRELIDNLVAQEAELYQLLRANYHQKISDFRKVPLSETLVNAF